MILVATIISNSGLEETVLKKKLNPCHLVRILKVTLINDKNIPIQIRYFHLSNWQCAFFKSDNTESRWEDKGFTDLMMHRWV